MILPFLECDDGFHVPDISDDPKRSRSPLLFLFLNHFFEPHVYTSPNLLYCSFRRAVRRQPVINCKTYFQLHCTTKAGNRHLQRLTNYHFPSSYC